MEQKLTPQQLKEFIGVLDEFEKYRNMTAEEKELIVRDIMERPYMDLRCDWAFKHVFQNPELLRMLLDDFLPEDIASVSLLPNEIDRIGPEDKNIVMDVICKTPDGKEFIVEMQRQDKDSFKNRMFYYGASMVHGQLIKGGKYSSIKPVYVICFMDYTLPHETDQLVYRYQMLEEDSGELFGQQLSIYLCELPRLETPSMRGLSPIESWFYILKNMRNFAGKPEDLGSRYAPVAKASRMRKLPSLEQLQYMRNMITEEEKLDLIRPAYRKGFAEGEEKGIVKGKMDDAKKMLELNLPVETIIQVTGLSINTIEKLK